MGQVARFNKKGEVDKILPNDIDIREASMIHVVMVASRADPKMMEYVHKAYVQKFDQKSWDKHSKNFPKIGKQTSFVLHDGKLWEEQQKKAQADARAKRAKELKEQAERELIEEMKAKMKLEAKAAKELAEEDKEPSFKEMREKAKELGMQVSNTTKKSELIEFLKEKEAL